MDTRQTMDSMHSVLPQGNPPLSFADLTLGILIRGVPSGLLFRGTWNGEAVSIKVAHSALCSAMIQDSALCSAMIQA